VLNSMEIVPQVDKVAEVDLVSAVADGTWDLMWGRCSLVPFHSNCSNSFVYQNFFQKMPYLIK
jgi:hypothetical protein